MIPLVPAEGHAFSSNKEGDYEGGDARYERRAALLSARPRQPDQPILPWPHFYYYKPTRGKPGFSIALYQKRLWILNTNRDPYDRKRASVFMSLLFLDDGKRRTLEHR